MDRPGRSAGQGCVTSGLYTSLYTSAILAHRVSVNSREVIRAIERAGWVHAGTRGSHRQFAHPKRPGRVTVPHPQRDIPVGTPRSIERQAGVKLK